MARGTVKTKSAVIPAGSIGEWSVDSHGMPVFELTARLPVHTPGARTGAGQPPGDPWFILGNYGLTAFAHGSGGYQLMSCERGFARLNYGGGPEAASWACHARVRIDNTRSVGLLGLESPAARAARKLFGCGFARFEYDLGGGIRCARTLSTVPSRDHRDRIPALLITVELENGSDAAHRFRLEEGLDACYDLANWHNPPAGRVHARYPVTCHRHRAGAVSASFEPHEEQPLVFAARDKRAQTDGFPPELCLRVFSISAGRHGTSFNANAVRVTDDRARLSAWFSSSLDPGEKRTFGIAVGYVWPVGPRRKFLRRLSNAGDGFPFRAQWRSRIPAFKGRDRALALEMQWHAYVLRAMASWDEFYQETYIPQGTVYEYALGVSACSRDHLQHCLPLCHYDADLARSILRYIAKHTDVYGRIRHTDEGLGFFPRGGDEKSDSQIYAFMALAEYLRVNRDASFLDESVPFDGMIGSGTMFERIELWFRYLRDCVATGAHGLVRTMNADWNDGAHHLWFKGLRYHQVFGGESHLNTTMALAVMQDMLRALETLRPGRCSARTRRRLPVLVAAIRDYRTRLLKAFMADWKGRAFVPRAYAAGEAMGLDELFLEPQPYVLGLADVPIARRKRLWREIKRRVWDGEKKGARQRETPGSRGERRRVVRAQRPARRQSPPRRPACGGRGAAPHEPDAPCGRLPGPVDRHVVRGRQFRLVMRGQGCVT